MVTKILFFIFCMPLTLLEAGNLPFGFSGLEIFKIGQRTSMLHAGNFNGDKLTDCLLVDNSKGSISFLLQRKKGEKTEPEITEINDIPSDLRFKRKDNLTEKKIFSVALLDLNSDGKSDIAFLGDPEGLEIHWGGKKWDEDHRLFTIQHSIGQSFSLLPGDIDGDKLPDLLVLTYSGFQVYKQTKDSIKPGKLIPLDGKKVNYATLKDINGDGRLDLLYTVSSRKQIRIRFGEGDSFGPEKSFRIASLSYLRCGDLCKENKGVEIAAVQKSPLRLSIFGLREEKSTQPLGELSAYSLEGGGDIKAFDLGDVNRDGKPDLCYALSNGADIGIRFGKGDGTFGSMHKWPTLSGVESIQVVTTGGKKSLLVLSKDEKSLGIMSWDGKRLSFPDIITLPGTPIFCVPITDPEGKKKLALAYSTGSSKYILSIGNIEKNKFKEDFQVKFSKRIKGILTGDFNGDSVEELLVFQAYDAPLFLLWDGKNKFKKLDPVESRTKSFLEKIEPYQLSTGSIGKGGSDQLFLANKNFIRVMRLDKNGKLQVVDQYHALSGSKLSRARVMDLECDGKPEILAYDATSNNLVIFRKQSDGLMKPVAYQEILGIGNYKFYPKDLDGDKKIELVFPRLHDIAVVKKKSKSLNLKSLMSYEIKTKQQDQTSSSNSYSSRRTGGADTVAALALGDLNGDGNSDIAFVTSKKIRMYVLEVQKDKLKRVLEFPIIEKKSTGYGSDSTVRQILIEDVTGDKLKDLMLLIHDRLLLYPQDKMVPALKGGK